MNITFEYLLKCSLPPQKFPSYADYLHKLQCDEIHVTDVRN